MHRLPRLLGVLFVAGALAAPAAFAASNGRSPSAEAGKTFTYASQIEVMVAWDPSNDYSNEVIAMPEMYEGLTRYDSVSKTVRPLLATSWKSAKGATEWTFKLRPGVTFHTGRPLTAQAAKASIERTMKISQGAAYIWGAVKSIDTPDQRTLVFHLKYAAPLDLITSSTYGAWIYDAQAVPAADLHKWFEQGHDAGTGPYTVDSWRKGEEVELSLKAYPKYWGGWSGSHYTDIVYRVVPADTTRAQLLRAGQVTFVERLSPQLWQSFKGETNVQTTSGPSLQNEYLSFNTKRSPLSDKRVRQAIGWAFNYDALVAVLKGAITKDNAIIPPGLWGHADTPSYRFDPAKAKVLLQQAGYGPGGKRISLELTFIGGDDTEAKTATVLKSSLAPLNIDVQMHSLQWTALWSKAKSSNLDARQDIAIFQWWPDYPDPYSWFINNFHTENPPFFNDSYYSNPKVDALMERAEQLAGTNRAQAIQLYHQLHTILLDDLPSLFVGDLTYQRAFLKSMSGYIDNPLYPNVVFVYNVKPLK